MLVRNKFFPVALRGDIKQAFLQARVKEEERDALRFHWIKEKDPKQTNTAIYKSIVWTGLVTICFAWNTRRASSIQEKR